MRTITEALARPDDALSDREREIVALIARGLQNYEIAIVLTVSVETVKSHVKHILVKLQARNRSHAAAMWATQSIHEEDLAGLLLARASAAAERREARTGEPWELRWLDTAERSQ